MCSDCGKPHIVRIIGQTPDGLFNVWKYCPECWPKRLKDPQAPFRLYSMEIGTLPQTPFSTRITLS